MKTIITIILLAVASINLSLAQTEVTVTLTTEQEQAVTSALETMNAERATLETPLPPLTVREYATMLIQAKFAQIVWEQRTKIKASFDAAWTAADEKKRADAKDVLEGKKSVEAATVEGGGK